jgi:hypothetical protein
MIWCLLKIYINCWFYSILYENYKLYIYSKNHEDSHYLNTICIMSSCFVGSITMLNSYFIYNDIIYYLQ